MTDLTAFIGVMLLGITLGLALWIIAADGAYARGYKDGYDDARNDRRRE